MSLQLKQSYVLIILVLALVFPYVFAIFSSRPAKSAEERLAQLETAVGGMNKLEEALEAERAESAKLRDEYQRSRAAQLQREGELQQNLANLRSELLPQVNALNEEKDLLVKKLKDFEQMTETLKKLNQQLDANTAKLKATEEDLAQMQKVAEQRQETITKLEEERKMLSAKAKQAETLKGQVQKLEARLQDEAAVKGELLTKISGMEKDLAKARENPELKAAQGQMAKMEAEMLKLRSSKNYSEAVKGDLLRQISRLQEQVAQMDPELASTEQEREDEVAAWINLEMQSQERLVTMTQELQQKSRKLEEMEYLMEDHPLQAAAANVMDLNLPEEVSAPGELNVRAVPLMQALRNATRDQLAVAKRDTEIQRRNFGTLVARIPVHSGNSPMPVEQAEAIRATLTEADSKSFFLVATYAGANSEASPATERAAVVTEFVRPMLKSGALLQAVDLGATQQFDAEAPAKNRMVELWMVP